jgi:hypothetical protein
MLEVLIMNKKSQFTDIRIAIIAMIVLFIMLMAYLAASGKWSDLIEKLGRLWS